VHHSTLWLALSLQWIPQYEPLKLEGSYSP
jgi:hypothetical protein